MAERADAVVIGAGVIGSAVAFELAKGGRSVVVVDKGPAPGAGSTSSSAAIIRFSYSTLAGVLTAWEAAAMWHDLAGHLGCADPDGMARFTRTGMLIFDTPSVGTDRVARLWDEVGIAYEHLAAAEISRRWPGLDVGSYYPPKRIDDPHFADDPVGQLGAMFEPDAGHMDDPMLCARNLAYAARQHGAVFRFHEQVVGIERAGGRVSGVALTGGGRIDTPVVVNVGGPHSAGINRMAGVADAMRIHHRPLRQEVFSAEAPAGMRMEDGFPITSDADIGQYLKPQAGGIWMVGSTEPECDPLHWVADPDEFDEYPTVQAFETTMLRVARRVPAFGVPHRPIGLAAMYDVSDDWVPVYDKSDLPGFFMACGTSGNQFKTAPLAGRYIAALVDAEAAGIDHDEQPVQYRGERTGRTIDLAAFSRRRDPAVTSGTVMG